jgi:uncharacterized protein YbjT (DUF2867 family)
MAEKKVIAVVGATGSQGGGLVRAILNDPNSEFAVRALTRNPESEIAKEFASKGAEVLKADVDDRDSIRRAFEGVYGAFCITFFWAHYSPEREMNEARMMAELAKESGLKHVVWSTLEDTRKWIPLSDNRMPTLQGKYKVPHLDAKGESEGYFRELAVPTTFLLTSFYWDNFINFGMGPQRGPDGKLAITMPMGDKKLPGIAAEDIGKCTYGIFKKGAETIGKTIAISGEHLTGSEMAAEFSRALGQEVHYNSVSPEAYRGLGFPGADDLGNMFQFKRDFNEYFTGIRNPSIARALNPELQDFRTWLSRNINRVPIGQGAATA